MNGRKLIGLIAFFVATGMVLMILVNDRFAELIIIALLLLLGYCCFTT